MVFLIVFWSPKQSKIEESSIESMAKQLEAHLYEEPKPWSFIILFQKQIMNARRESKERNLTWRIQEDSNYWTLLENFLESISCILYIFFFKLGKSGIQCFKRWANQSWNEEVIAIRSQSHQAEGQFRNCKISLWVWNHKVIAAKSAFGCKMETFSLQNFVAYCACLRNHPECFQIFATDTFRFFLQIFVV